jgi:hypothetical protein
VRRVHHAVMRLHFILVLIGLLALSALPTDAAGRYTVLGIGAESCQMPVAKPGGGGDAPYRVGLEALLRITCLLDSTLLQVEAYGRANPANVPGHGRESPMSDSLTP